MAVQLESLHQPGDEPPIVFVSYSHLDREWKDQIRPPAESLGKAGPLR